MMITMNGELADTREAATVAELVRVYDLPPKAILVEHNGLALHRQEWTQKRISEGDNIEIIRVVAGG
jgi:sulfur carrier protein